MSISALEEPTAQTLATPMSGLHVVECGQGVAAAFAAKLMALLRAHPDAYAANLVGTLFELVPSLDRSRSSASPREIGTAQAAVH